MPPSPDHRNRYFTLTASVFSARVENVFLLESIFVTLMFMNVVLSSTHKSLPNLSVDIGIRYTCDVRCIYSCILKHTTNALIQLIRTQHIFQGGRCRDVAVTQHCVRNYAEFGLLVFLVRNSFRHVLGIHYLGDCQCFRCFTMLFGYFEPHW